MLRRFKVFSFGVLIGFIIIFSNDRLRNNFLEYLDWSDSNMWVLKDLIYEFRHNHDPDITYSDSVLSKLNDENQDTSYLSKVLGDGDDVPFGWVNQKKSNLDLFPPIFVIENMVDGEGLSVHFQYDESNHRVVIVDFYNDQEISEKSYTSRYLVVFIFLGVMVPILFLIRALIRKRRKKYQ